MSSERKSLRRTGRGGVAVEDGVDVDVSGGGGEAWEVGWLRAARHAEQVSDTSASVSRGLLGNYLKEGLKKKKQVPTVFLLPRSAGSLAMATQRDVSAQSDISKMQAEGDGSFKRKPSTFRNFIEKGGKFEPEKGERMPSGILSFFA